MVFFNTTDITPSSAIIRPTGEISEKRYRKKYGLSEQEISRRHWNETVRKALLTPLLPDANSDLITMETVISTPAIRLPLRWAACLQEWEG